MNLSRPTFQVVRYREGYAAEQVDLAVEMVLENLALPRPRIDRSDIEALRFMPVRMRSSYEMSSVDDWFGDAADELDLRHGTSDEERPRTGGPDAPAPVAPTTPSTTTPSTTTPGAIEEVGSGWGRVLVVAAVVVVLAVLVYVSFA